MYEIREYSSIDRQQVINLWVDVSVKEHGFTEWKDKISDLKEEEYEKILVAVFEGEIIGTIAYEKVNNEDVELRRVYVYPKHRGNGLAKKLLDKIIEEIKKNGYKKILVGTYEKYVSGRRFYEKNNFILLKVQGDEYKYILEL